MQGWAVMLVADSRAHTELHTEVCNADVLAKHAGEFKRIKTFTVEQVFGSWQKAQQPMSPMAGRLTKWWPTHKKTPANEPAGVFSFHPPRPVRLS
jgi:hypothetical protein